MADIIDFPKDKQNGPPQSKEEVAETPKKKPAKRKPAPKKPKND